MAAASNKPVGLQITLVIFVLLTLVFAVVAFSFHRELSKQTADAAKAKNDMEAQKRLFGDASNDKRTLITVLGASQDQRVEDPAANDAGTVKGVANDTIKKTGPHAGSNLLDTLEKVQTALATSESNRQLLETQLQKQNQENIALEGRYRAISLEHDKAKQKAEADLQDLIRKRDELLTAKDRENASLRKDWNDAQAEIQNLNEQQEKERKRFSEEITRLEGINDKIRTELDELKQVSFEVADGLIRRVENSTKMVWINLGTADYLKPRVTFSVYARDNSGIGRGQEEIKGKIEVTRIIDAHMSEAKILDEDLYRPMAPGDQIYSPLWNPGRIEKFSLIGTMDLDRDGRDDRELLHQIIATAGAAIDNEVDDNGNRTPPESQINEQTKFLVLGDIPDIATLTKPEDKDRAQKVMDHLKAMQKEARLSGVRIVSLSDFLSYIGYKPKRRLFQPGQEHPYNLNQGAHSPAVNAPLERNRDSTGNVSGAINRNKNKKQDISPGETSKLFGTKKDY